MTEIVPTAIGLERIRSGADLAMVLNALVSASTRLPDGGAQLVETTIAASGLTEGPPTPGAGSDVVFLKNGEVLFRPPRAGVWQAANRRRFGEVGVALGLGGETPVADRTARGLDDVLSRRRGVRQRFEDNLGALAVVSSLRESEREPDETERGILAGFSGWGSMPGAFNLQGPDSGIWEWNDKRRLSAALSSDAYEEARRSTLNGHYTSAPVIDAMYRGLARLGVKGEASEGDSLRLLEPSAGAGYFLGLMPPDLARVARVTAVELDPTSAAVAAALYPKANVVAGAFEDQRFGDNFFDAAVGNVPFLDVGPRDKSYESIAPSLHDYFILKTADHLKPGGVAALITSAWTLDKLDERARRALHDKVELISAIRLPDRTFRASAGTDVVTDILFMKKRARPLSAMTEEERAAAIAAEPAWLSLSEVPDPRGGKPIPINKYFVDRPDAVLGTVERSGTLYGQNSERAMNVVWNGTDADLEKALMLRMKELPENAFAPSVSLTSGAVVPVAGDVKLGAYFADETGGIYRNMPGGPKRPEPALTAEEESAVRDSLKVRDALRAVFQASHEGMGEAAKAKRRVRLSRLYDGFVERHGRFRDKAMARLLAGDPDGPLLAALEVVDEKGKFREKAPVFTVDTIAPARSPARVKSPAEALAVSLNELGRADIGRMAELLGVSVAKARTLSKGHAFEDPATGRLQPAAVYLTGDVREKLDRARVAAAADPAFEDNVKALEAAQPKDIPYTDIEVRLGAPWVPVDDVRAFVAHILNEPVESFEVVRDRVDGAWSVRAVGKRAKTIRSLYANVKKWGTERRPALDLVQDLLNGKPIAVATTDDKGGRRIDVEETTGAQAKAFEIKEAFKDWIWADRDRRGRLARTYNTIFNAIRPTRYDGGHLTFPGMSPDWRARMQQHQKNAIWRALSHGRAYYVHEVGTYKTSTLSALSQELKRLGRAAKPMIAVQGSTLANYAQTLREMYPSKNFFVMPEGDIDAAKRKKLMAQIATGTWDAVVVTHDNLDMLPLRPETEADYLRRVVREYSSAIEDARRDAAASAGREDNRIVKRMERTRESLKRRIGELLETGRRDDTVYFEDLGVDALLTDEAHRYKNLMFPTQMQNVRGVPSADAARAMRYEMLLDTQRAAGRPIVEASWTPISNTIAEAYTIMRHLQPEELERRGIKSFDAWAATFGDVVTRMELSVAMQPRMTSRLARFVNMTELSQIMSQVTDTVFAEDVSAISRPRAHVSVVEVDPDPRLKDFVVGLAARASRLSYGSSADNMLKITTEGRLAALDLRMIDPAAIDATGKIDRAVPLIAKIWRENPSGAQLVFSDLGVGPTKFNPGFVFIEELKRKLVEAGIQEDQIADFYNATKKQRFQLMRAMNDGRARIAVGSTEKLGTGTNVQKRLLAAHDLDVPWKPSAVSQRRGRTERDGNEYYDVGFYRYVTRGTFDAVGWQFIDTKNRFLRQFLKNESTREFIDHDTDELTPAQVSAIASGNPLLMKRAELEQAVATLERQEIRHRRDRAEAESDAEGLEETIRSLSRLAAEAEPVRDAAIAGLEAPPIFVPSIPGADAGEATGTIEGNRRAIGEAILQAALASESSSRSDPIGVYRGFSLIAEPGYPMVKIVVRPPTAPGGFGEGRRGDVDPRLLGVVDFASARTWDSLMRALDGQIAALAALPGKIETEREQFERTLRDASAISEAPFRGAKELDRKRSELKWVTRILTLPKADDKSVLALLGGGLTHGKAAERLNAVFMEMEEAEADAAGAAGRESARYAEIRGKLDKLTTRAASLASAWTRLDPSRNGRREIWLPAADAPFRNRVGTGAQGIDAAAAELRANLRQGFGGQARSDKDGAHKNNPPAQEAHNKGYSVPIGSIVVEEGRAGISAAFGLGAEDGLLPFAKPEADFERIAGPTLAGALGRVEGDRAAILFSSPMEATVRDGAIVAVASPSASLSTGGEDWTYPKPPRRLAHGEMEEKDDWLYQGIGGYLVIAWPLDLSRTGLRHVGPAGGHFDPAFEREHGILAAELIPHAARVFPNDPSPGLVLDVTGGISLPVPGRPGEFDDAAGVSIPAAFKGEVRYLPLVSVPAPGDTNAPDPLDIFHHESFHAMVREGRFAPSEIALFESSPFIREFSDNDPRIQAIDATGGFESPASRIQEAAATLFGRYAAARARDGRTDAFGPAERSAGTGPSPDDAASGLFDLAYVGSIGSRPIDPAVRDDSLRAHGYSGPDDPRLPTINPAFSLGDELLERARTQAIANDPTSDVVRFEEAGLFVQFNGKQYEVGTLEEASDKFSAARDEAFRLGADPKDLLSIPKEVATTQKLRRLKLA